MYPAPTQEQPRLFEMADLARVSEGERQHTETRDVLWLWFATNLTAPSLAVGLLGVLFGLGFWGSVAVMVGFTLLGATPVAFFSTWGPKTGLTQMVIARFSFGYYGAKVPAAFNGCTGVCWIAFNTIIGANCLSIWSGGKIPMWLALALLLTVTTVISLFGYYLLQRVERFLWLLMTVPLLILLAVIGPQVNIQAAPASALTSGPALAAAIATFGGVVFAHAASWGPLAADFTRRMPVETPSRRVFAYAFLGLAAPCIQLEILGALLTSCAGASDPLLLASGPGTVLAHLLSNPFLSGVVLLSFTLSVIANNIPPSYSLPFSFQLVGLRRVPHPILIGGVGVLALLLSLLFMGQFGATFENFLLLISYWLAAWMAVELVEHWLRRGHFARLDHYDDARHLPPGRPALLAFALGLAVTSLGVSQAVFIGPVAQALGGADLGYPLALVATGLSYYLLRRAGYARRQRPSLPEPLAFEQPSMGIQPVLSSPASHEVGVMNWQTVFHTVQCRLRHAPSLVDLSTGAPLLEPAVCRAAAQAAGAIQRLPDAGQALLGTYAHAEGWKPLLDAFRACLGQRWHRTVAQDEVAVIPGVSLTLHLIHEALRDRAPGVFGLADGPYRLLFPAGGLEYFGLGDRRNSLPPAYGPYLTETVDADRFRVLLPDPSALDWEDVGAVCLSHPHCPSGRLWSEGELLPLAEAAGKHGAVVLLDEEAAFPLAPLSETLPALVDHPQMLHVFSFSKVGLAGVRIGLAAGSPAWMAALRALVHDATIKVSTLDQFVASAALQVLEQAPPTSWFGARYAERWNSAFAALQDAGALDDSRQLARWEGGPYAWYTWRTGPTSTEVFYRLLEAGIAICPAEALQMVSAESNIRGIRIGLGGVQDLADYQRALTRLAQALAPATASLPVQNNPRAVRRQAAIDRVLEGAHT